MTEDMEKTVLSKARRFAIIMSIVQLLAALAFPFPFWKEAWQWIQAGSDLHYVSWLGLALYLGILLCAGSVLGIAVNQRQQVSRRRRKIALILASFPVFSLLVKWIPSFPFDSNNWFVLFHNRMGLGMEILGPIPNLFLDGCLFAVSVVTLFSLGRLHRLTGS